jgi:hypothetical protein
LRMKLEEGVEPVELSNDGSDEEAPSSDREAAGQHDR